MNNYIENKRLFIFILSLLIIQIFYFFIYFFTSGIFIQYGYNLTDLTFGIILFSILFLHILILIYLILIFIGYKNKETWMRKFTIFYLIWGILWGIWGIIIGNNILLHLILILFYIIGFYYLSTEEVKKFFYKIYRYGKYTLYTIEIELKSGKKQPIFFFSPRTPKNGIPTAMPEGYKIKENLRSHMPYLKKIEKLQKKDNSLKKQKNNVLYVVKYVNSDRKNIKWAVRSKNKLISYHIKKQAALKNARKIAKDKKLRILVQKTNGQFSYGFKTKTE